MTNPAAARHPLSRNTITTIATALLLTVFLSGCTANSAMDASVNSPPATPSTSSTPLPFEGNLDILSSSLGAPPGIVELPTSSGENRSIFAYEVPATTNRFYLTTLGSPGTGCHPDARSYSVGADGTLTITLYSFFANAYADPAHSETVFCVATSRPVTDLVELPETVTIPDEIIIHAHDGLIPDLTILVRTGASG